MSPSSVAFKHRSTLYIFFIWTGPVTLLTLNLTHAHQGNFVTKSRTSAHMLVLILYYINFFLNEYLFSNISGSGWNKNLLGYPKSDANLLKFYISKCNKNWPDKLLNYYKLFCSIFVFIIYHLKIRVGIISLNENSQHLKDEQKLLINY